MEEKKKNIFKWLNAKKVVENLTPMCKREHLLAAGTEGLVQLVQAKWQIHRKTFIAWFRNLNYTHWILISHYLLMHTIILWTDLEHAIPPLLSLSISTVWRAVCSCFLSVIFNGFNVWAAMVQCTRGTFKDARMYHSSASCWKRLACWLKAKNWAQVIRMSNVHLTRTTNRKVNRGNSFKKARS